MEAKSAPRGEATDETRLGPESATAAAGGNRCRVYDIDEVDGHTFLSMEYVDGEDLSSLLRRIGRFPEERGLEVARQVCAGLAAAHERAVAIATSSRQT